MATATDIMTADPIILESSMLIKDVVEIFSTKKISSAPVVSSMGEVAGQLTEMGLVRAMVLNQLQPNDFNKIAHCEELLEPAAFVTPKDPIPVVLKTLLKSSSRRVLVKSDGRRIFGIISPKDIMRVLLEKSNSAAKAAVQEEIGKLGTAQPKSDASAKPA